MQIKQTSGDEIDLMTIHHNHIQIIYKRDSFSNKHTSIITKQHSHFRITGNWNEKHTVGSLNFSTILARCLIELLPSKRTYP